jgi:ferredoxin
MAGKSAVIDYNICDFKNCKEGVCLAAADCEKKVLKQEEPFETPYIDASLCSGCNKCISSCPSGAIKRSK